MELISSTGSPRIEFLRVARHRKHYLPRTSTARSKLIRELPPDAYRLRGPKDVNNVTTSYANKQDETASFWFAEVLKYLFLIFDDPDHMSLNDCTCFSTVNLSDEECALILTHLSIHPSVE